MQNQFSRTELLLGKDAMERLKQSRVAVFGVGGVGGYAAEALARSGIGTLDLIDNDKVCLSNLNRQIIALHSTVGQYKVDAAAARIRDICPEIRVNPHRCFFLPETADQFDFSQYDFVIDAIDTVKGKLEIVLCAKAANTPVISSMGAGNKLDPTAFRVADIYQTKVCPLARVMRYELKKRGVRSLRVVYSEEVPVQPIRKDADECRSDSISLPAAQNHPARRTVPGSTAFVPSVAGLIIAGEVVKELSGLYAKRSIPK